MTLSLLNGCGLVRGDVEVRLPAGEQRLLAFLGIHGPSCRALVAGTLWPSVTEGRALGSLRTAIWRVNRGDAGLVTVSHDRLSLSPAMRVDLHELCERALRLIAGEPDEDAGEFDVHEFAKAELLPGWYEEWLVYERERLRQLQLHALEALSEQLVSRGRYASAVQAALEAVRMEPLRESSHRAVIAVHLAEDNVAEALRHYEHVCDLLRAELRVEPSDRLKALLARQVKPRQPHQGQTR
jgi:DNA-binding SARP family transcriptional activator